MAKLETTFAGVRMSSPISVAAMLSLTGVGRIPRNYADMLLKYVEAGAGCVYTAGTTPEDEQPLEKLKASSRVVPARIHGYNKPLGTYCVSDPYIFTHSFYGTLEVIRILKEQLPPDVPIIGDIIGSGADPEGWVKAAKLMVQAGAHLIELDASCPFSAGTVAAERREYAHTAVAPEAESELAQMGICYLLADQPEPLYEVTKAVVEAVKVPVGVKISPESGFPRNLMIMKVAAKAGARFAASINGPLTVAPPDIHNDGKPIYPFLGINPVAGFTGPWLYPMVTRNIGTGVVFVPELDHSAVGGIVSPQQVVELLMMGAKHIGLASAIYMTEGVRGIRRFTHYLSTYLDEHGYESVDQLIGAAKKYIQPVTKDTDWGHGRVVARVDYDKCTECGRCIEGYCFGAIVEDAASKGRPIVKEDLCGACGFCVLICPEAAYSMVELKKPHPPTLEWEVPRPSFG